MASEQQGAIKPSTTQLDALAKYVRENMEVVKSAKSGKFYVTLTKSARNGQFGDLEGRIDFCAMGLTDASVKAANRVERAKSALAGLTPEERQAAIEELLG